jgi:hypothetical protein
LRANPLAKKILSNQIARGTEGTEYFPDTWACSSLIWENYTVLTEMVVLNDTVYPDSYNYFDPVLPKFINGRYDPTSQRHHNTCPVYNVTMPDQPPFAFHDIAIGLFPCHHQLELTEFNVFSVGNSFCASTCAQFTTIMVEKHNVKIAAVGGMPGEAMQYKGPQFLL